MSSQNRLLLLPEEILIDEILLHLGVRDVLSFAAASKNTNTIVRNNPSIQYKIELGVAGLVPTGRTNAELTLSERIRRLENLVSRSVPDLHSPGGWKIETIDLSGVSFCHALVGGVLARSLHPIEGEDRPVKGSVIELKNFYSDPELKHVQTSSWRCMNSFEFISIDPPLDVLFGFERRGQLSILQLSTGEPHSEALKPTVQLSLAMPHRGEVRHIEAQVIEHVLGVYSSVRMPWAGAWRDTIRILQILDWTKGIKTHVLPDIKGASQWCLAAHDMLLVLGPPNSRPFFTLNLYSLRNTSRETNPATPMLLAKYLFPHLHPIETMPSISLSVSPTSAASPRYPDNTNEFTHTSDPRARLVSIKYKPHVPRQVTRPTYQFISPIAFFMDHSGYVGRSPLIFSWVLWGPSKVRCFVLPSEASNRCDDIFLDGWQVLSEYDGVMDFNPLRVQRHISQSPMHLNGIPETRLVRDRNTIPLNLVFADTVNTRLPYIKGGNADTIRPQAARRAWTSRTYDQGTLFTFYRPQAGGHDSISVRRSLS